ncbi:thioredoxin-like protein [Macrolepiota fuliginosa MF-IS2]|uniref:Thioredoxin-like protein n=1 Tax=Macrolepiota fuliginosa MF-IS2 TaxID=1400762 RepID=A0A9P5XJR8_9AGAR|nr:thioredoxin-like protein [Macrolepiota fuliginosa MF-IS2]
MPSDSKISSLGARLVEPNQTSRRRRTDDSEEEDDDAIFAELEAEIENDDNATMRERGLETIKREMERMKGLRESQHGMYSEITDEKEVVRISAREPRCIIHFYHSNFKRCEIMDKHLAKLAPKYFHTRFLRVFVENIPWLVERLSIKVLPCVICFIDGVSRERLIGFEEFGNNDSFDTAALEMRLLNAGLFLIFSRDPLSNFSTGVLEKPNGSALDSVYKVSSSTGDDDEVFDLDD